MTDIKFVGCGYVEPSNFILDVPVGADYLFILTHTPAFFWVEGVVKEYPAHSAVLFQTGQKVYYRASGENFTNDYVRFASTETYVTSNTLPYGVPFPMKDPYYCSYLVQMLFTEVYLNNDSNNCSEITIEYLMMILFNKMMESYSSINTLPKQHELFELRKLINSKPNNKWSVDVMAELLHISPGYLQYIYKNTFGITCMQEVINARIRMAKEFLVHANHSLAGVADLCGYNNVEHFCRQFKQIAGCTPGEYRGKALQTLN